MVSIKQEPSYLDDIKMISIKQESGTSSWDDPNNIDIDWECEFMDFPPSLFTSADSESEQAYGSGNPTVNGWDQQASSEPQIRHDCMWSGRCFDQSHPSKTGCATNHGTTNDNNNTQEQTEVINKFSTVTAVAAASLNNNVAAIQKPILTPANTSAMNINNNTASKIITVKPQAAQIPAGRSLLINPRIKQQQQQMSRIPPVSTSDFLRDRETSVLLHRPDTPLSLDEDPPEFKHNIDLATCTIGSNRMSLTNNSRHYRNHQNHHDDPSSHRIINMLKEELEDPESSNFRTCMTSSSGEIGSLTDLLNDLDEIEGRDGDDSHGEELDSDTDSNPDSGCRSSKGGGISEGYTKVHHQELSPSSSSSSSSSYEYQGTHVGDHSYTRPKDVYHLNGLGVLTPSDSEEEEIDVVSIGEKNLPTNPTPREKRHVESRVALKIRKHPVNSSHHHHHHRRRHSDDEYAAHHHGSTSGASHLSPSKSYGFSPNYLTPASSTTISGANTPLPPGGSSSISNPRKRPSKDDRSNGKNRHHQHRSKKQRIPGKTVARSPESSEEQETLEKRNLHNDMERQRRIGLKNLFEELKRQIPSLRDKERAPKVNILREAALLCTRLNREQEQRNALQKHQQRLYARVRQLRTSLHSQRRMD